MKYLRRLRCRYSLWWLMLPLLAMAAAPDVALRDVDGRSHHLKEYIGRGQWTVVAVWSVDCIICQRELPYVAFFHDTHRKTDAAVLGVSVDGYADRARVKKFIDEYALGFPNVLGERQDVVKLGGGPFRGTPTFLIYSPEGQLVARHVGASDPEFLDRELTRLKAQQGKAAQ